MDFLQGIRTNPERAWLFAGLVFLGLNALLRVPDLAIERFPMALEFYLSDPTRLYYFFSLDLFCLLSLLVILPLERTGTWVYRMFAAAILLLLAYRTYDAVVVSIWHRSPIFYADAPHVVGAFYLLLNASVSRIYLAGALAVGGAIALLAWWLPALLRNVHHCMRRPPFRRRLLAAHLALWPLVSFASITDRGIERHTYQEVCLLTTECIAYNVQASVELKHRTVRRQRGGADSTYIQYRDVNWSNVPSVYVVMLESYGMALAEHPSLEAPYEQLMAWAADSLAHAGWHSASAPSVAPVSGGLSWLSVATVLTGTPIAHQPTYEVLRADLPRYPHLVRLLQRQGYQTATVQPPVRARPGLRVENLYGFDQAFFLEDLDYRGPGYGWGIVPDQYSLSVAHERFVEEAERPFFLFFEAVTTHGPWNREPPPLVETASHLNRSPAPTDLAKSQDDALGRVEDPASDATTQAERFFRHVQYDWRVLVDYLSKKAPANSLVLVLGDHQPPFADDRSFATPVHVLSQDRALVRRFEAHGLTPGLQIPATADPLHHAGLYSLLVRVLTAHDGALENASAGPLPTHRPEGVRRSALLGSPS